MEFAEKLQQLRKKRGLTQEELAGILYVSRAAVSKWESGRGYPNIETLKEISVFFSVSIDDLLSGEKLIFIAEKENSSNIRNLCNALFTVSDIFFMLLIFLPLYPDTADGFVYSVNLFHYKEITKTFTLVYLVLFIALIVLGFVRLILTRLKIKRHNKFLSGASLLINIIVVLCLSLTRQAYAAVLSFLLLIIKVMILIKILQPAEGRYKEDN